MSTRIPLRCSCGRSITLMIIPDGPEPPAPLLSSSSFSGRGHRTPLTALETEALQRAAHGATDQEISTELGLSISSIRYAMRDAIARLAARNRTEAVYRAVSAELILPEPASSLVANPGRRRNHFLP